MHPFIVSKQLSIYTIYTSYNKLRMFQIIYNLIIKSWISLFDGKYFIRILYLICRSNGSSTQE